MQTKTEKVRKLKTLSAQNWWGSGVRDGLLSLLCCLASLHPCLFFPSTFMFRVSFPPVPEIFAVWLDFHFSDPLGPPEPPLVFFLWFFFSLTPRATRPPWFFFVVFFVLFLFFGFFFGFVGSTCHQTSILH